jgi:hypothetical protein
LASVLEIPPIDSAETAVKMAVAARLNVELAMKALSGFYLFLSFLPGLLTLGAFGKMTSSGGFYCVILSIILSPCLTVLGLIFSMFSKPPRSYMFWVGTVVSALPGIYLLFAIFNASQISD